MKLLNWKFFLFSFILLVLTLAVSIRQNDNFFSKITNKFLVDAATSSISVDFSRVTGNISPLIRGFVSHYWVDKDTELAANNEAVITQAANLAPALVIFADGESPNYHWDPNRPFDPTQNIWGHIDDLHVYPCISPDGTYKPKAYTLGGLGGQQCDDQTVQSSWMDFDDYMKFVRTIGAEPFVVVHYYGAQESPDDPARDINRDSNEAAAWVQYSKNKGYNVKYWQIGNEPYLPPEWGNVSSNQAQYAADFLTFSSKMKAVDSTIKVGATVGYLGYNDPGGVRGLTPEQYCFSPYYGSGIFCEVLKQAGSNVDFLNLHGAFDASDLKMDGLSLTNWRRAVTAVVGSTRASQIGFVNSFYYIDDKNDTRCTNYSTYDVCPSSLKRALVLTVALARLGKENFLSATFASFRLPWPRQNGGILGGAGQAYPVPNYYALQLHTKHFGNQLVWASSQYPNSNVVVYASKSVDGTKGYILAVNYNPTNRFSSKFQIFGAKIKSAQAFTLNGDTLDSTSASIVQTNLGSFNSKSYSFPPHSATILELTF